MNTCESLATHANVPFSPMSVFQSLSPSEQERVLKVGLFAHQQYNQATAPSAVTTKNFSPELTVGSCDRGKLFEGLTEDVLYSLFPDAVVTRTTSQSHAADFHLHFGDVLVIVECKNYSSAISSQEVVKFENDLETTKAHIGLFLSLKGRIPGKKQTEVQRIGNRLVGFSSLQSEQELRGVAIMLRSMLAVHHIVCNYQDQEYFYDLSRQFKEKANALNKEINKYSNYQAKHAKNAKELANNIESLTTQLNNA